MDNNEMVKSFKVKYPNLFKEGSLRCGFYVGKGWLPLIEKLCAIIESQIEHSVPEKDKGEIYIDQIKEKFGGLRAYLNQSTPYIDGAIALSESLSYSICEECGNQGVLRSGGWLKTLCDEHANGREIYKNVR